MNTPATNARPRRAIVIDSATQRGAHAIATDSTQHTGVTIRGRAQAEDAYSLSLEAGRASSGSRSVPVSKA